MSCGVSSTANACEVCVAMDCCPQVSACDGDNTCLQYEACYDACYGGQGTGAQCSSKCAAEYRDSYVTALQECGAQSCLQECD